MYGPKLNGIAWLSDNLFIIVGAEYREVKEEDHDYPLSQDAPLIIIFDLKNKQIRSYIGEFFPARDYVKFKPNNFINESMLIFNFK